MALLQCNQLALQTEVGLHDRPTPEAGYPGSQDHGWAERYVILAPLATQRHQRQPCKPPYEEGEKD